MIATMGVPARTDVVRREHRPYDSVWSVVKPGSEADFSSVSRTIQYTVGASPTWTVVSPMVFNYSMSIMVQGERFRVDLDGTATLQRYNDGDSGDHAWWIYGVRPGGIAASGAELDGAICDFLNGLEGVFEDIASDSDCLDAFVRVVNDFVRSTDTTSVEDFDAVADRLSIPKKSPSVSVKSDRDQTVPELTVWYVDPSRWPR